MPKRKLCLILLVFTILLTACSDGKMKTKFPTDTYPPYREDSQYVVENLDYRDYIEYESIDKIYYTDYFQYGFNLDVLKSLIDGNREGYSTYIVKKVASKSYFWERMAGCELRFALTISELEIKAVLNDSQTSERKVGSKIVLPENYAIDYKGELIGDFNEFNPTFFYIYNSEIKLIDKGHYLKNDTYYLMIFPEDRRVSIPEETEIRSGIFFQPEYPNLYSPEPITVPFFEYDRYNFIELSEETYNRSLNVINDPIGYQSYMKGYSESVIYIFDNYGEVLPNVKRDNYIIYICFSIIFFGIIVVGIILAKRAKATPNGTPPTLEQTEPVATDTHEPAAPDTSSPPEPPNE